MNTYFLNINYTDNYTETFKIGTHTDNMLPVLTEAATIFQSRSNPNYKKLNGKLYDRGILVVTFE